MRKIVLVLITAAAITSGLSTAAEFTVEQKNDAFNPKTLKIKVGNTVNFRNADAYYHNVFSLTDGQSFDLGSYSGGVTKKQTFNKPGKVDVECAIHADMKLTVEVSK